MTAPDLAPVPSLAGTTVGGRYTIVRELGRGAMGVVYEALQRDLDRRVAVKVLHASADPHAEERLMREARAAGSVGHPNVVDVYDLGRLADGRPYVVMPMLEGHSLASEVQDEGLPIARVVWVVTSAANGLEVLHAKGLVHRDLKPENLFVVQHVDGTEVLKLLDFGLATRHDEVRLTGTGLVNGTPEYVAPETAEGIAPDRRADIYALGIIAFELLTGRTPFREGSPFKILQAKTSRAAPPMSDGTRSFPSEVEAVVARAIARLPNDRYDRARELAEALERAAAVAQPEPPRRKGRQSTVELESPLFAPAQDAPAPLAPAPPAAPHPLAAPDDEEDPVLPLARPRGLVPTMVGGALLIGVAFVAWTTLHNGEPATRPPPAPPPRSSPTPTAEHEHPTPAPISAPAVALAPSPVPATSPHDAHAVPPRHSARSGSGSEDRSTSPAPVVVPAPPPVVAPTPPVVAPATPVNAPAPSDLPRAVDPARGGELTRLATQALVRGAIGEAADYFREATVAEPRQPAAWRGLGIASERLGRSSDAARAYGRYLELAPSASDADAIRSRVDRLQGG